MHALPDWLDPTPWVDRARTAGDSDVRAALGAETPGERELAALLSPAAGRHLEAMAQRAQAVTRRFFGRTVSLFVPLYLSDYCSGGCTYCGFASDRSQPRHRLDADELDAELRALHGLGVEEILLLTGERTPKADFPYLAEAVSRTARDYHAVCVEAFPMSVEEYAELNRRGCLGVTVYQETYDPERYPVLHRWGPKRDYAYRLDTPRRVLAGGMHHVGLGALLGLSEPAFDLLCLYRHAQHLRREFWQGGVTVSFPRICPQEGGYTPAFPVSERYLAQVICAFRLCLPEVPLVLSTRERGPFRDGMAGIGITKMSVASRTTVGGYAEPGRSPDGQFQVSDARDLTAFCAALKARGLEPVFKNWDRVYCA